MNTQIKTSPESGNPGWAVWWRLLRPHTLTASIVPVAVGTALALQFEHFRTTLFLAMLIASILIQAATNMFNEYYDYERGLDDDKSVGIGGAIVRDGVASATVLTLALYFLVMALALGFYISMCSSWWLLPIGSICAMIGYLYSGGPYPISATPLGELVSGACMGVAIILISFFIQSGTVTQQAVLISIPTSILIGAILMANNIRDLEGDAQHGRKTLAILLGRKWATICLAGMFVLAYFWLLALVVAGIVTHWVLLAFVSLPKAIEASSGFRKNTIPKLLMPSMVATAQINTRFGLAVALGLLLHRWLS